MEVYTRTVTKAMKDSEEAPAWSGTALLNRYLTESNPKFSRKFILFIILMYIK